MKARVVLYLAAFALIVWLVVDRAAPESPWRDPEYVAQVTRPLNDAQRQALSEELLTLVTAAKLDTSISLNEPFRAGALNIYVTRSVQSARTGCRPGDARYDRRRDVVLVDEGVVWPTSAVVGFASVNVHAEATRSQATKTWFYFVVLHELGHKTLHGNDWWHLRRPPREAIEAAADEFAFHAMSRLPIVGGENQYDGATTIVLRIPEERAATDRSAALLASVIQNLSVTLLFGSAHFSPFYRDSAHQAFVARFRPQLYAALAKTTDRGSQTYVLLALAYLDRVEETGRSVESEIQSDAPITDVRFAGEELIVSTAPSEPGGPACLYRLHTVRTTRSTEGPSRIRLSEGRQTEVLSTWIAPEEVSDLSPLAAYETSGVRRIGEGDNAEWQVVTGDGTVAGSRAELSILKDLQKHFLLDDATLRRCLIVMKAAGGGSVDVGFTCGLDFYIGELRKTDLSLESLDAVVGPPPTEGAAHTLLDMRVAGRRELYIVVDTMTDVHTRRYAIEVWHVSASGRPRQVARQELVTDWIPTQANVWDWLRISHPAVVACGDVGEGLATCTEFLDSVFLFDAVGQKLAVLFYPAGARMVHDEAGHAAFYAIGGHKVFVTRLRKIV